MTVGLGNILGSTVSNLLPTIAGGQSGGYETHSLSRLSPEQQQLFTMLQGGASPGIQSGLQNLSNLASGDQSTFNQMEAPAVRQYGQNISQLASRFSGMGLGGRRSSGFNNSSTGAASQMAENLAARRSGLQQDAIRQLLGIGTSLSGQNTMENYLIPNGPTQEQQMLGAVSPLAGYATTQLFNGLFGGGGGGGGGGDSGGGGGGGSSIGSVIGGIGGTLLGGPAGGAVGSFLGGLF